MLKGKNCGKEQKVSCLFLFLDTFHFVKYAKIQIIPDLCFPLVLIWVNMGQKKTISRHILRSAFPIPHMGITCCQHCFREGSRKGMLYHLLISWRKYILQHVHVIGTNVANDILITNSIIRKKNCRVYRQTKILLKVIWNVFNGKSFMRLVLIFKNTFFTEHLRWLLL